MARTCEVTGKKTSTGNNRPWSKKATRRTFGINLQKKKVVVNGKVSTMKVTAKGLKTLKKQAKLA